MSSGVLHCVGSIFPDILMDHSFLLLDCLTLEDEAVHSIKISVTTYPAAQSLILEDFSVQESYCESHVSQ
jgi:hypothetical protein